MIHSFVFTKQAAVGFELWTMSKDILFDNIIVTDDIFVAEKWAADTFDKKRQKIAKDSVSKQKTNVFVLKQKNVVLYFETKRIKSNFILFFI